MITGDLRVWWIPQVPGKIFYVPVKNLSEAKFILSVLADYDQFQLDNRIKGDYCNTGGLQIFDQVYFDEDGIGWTEWSSFDGDCIDELSEAEAALSPLSDIFMDLSPPDVHQEMAVGHKVNNDNGDY